MPPAASTEGGLRAREMEYRQGQPLRGECAPATMKVVGCGACSRVLSAESCPHPPFGRVRALTAES